MFFIFLVLGECIRRMQINGFYARMFFDIFLDFYFKITKKEPIMRFVLLGN